MPQVQSIRDKKSRICAGFLYVIVLKNAVSRLIMILFFMENRNRGKISSYFYIFASMKKARNPLWDRAFCLKYLLRGLYMEAPPGIGPGNKGFADLCLTAWLWRRKNGADYGARTRHLHLGKVALYQMS